MTEQDELATLKKLLGGFRFAMLTSGDADGKLLAHPLTVQETEFDGDLWFIIGRSSTAVRNIERDPGVGVSFSSNDAWVSLAGTASVVDDRAKLEELWSTAVEAWFPEGPGDPEVTLLKVTALSGEYWDSPGRVATLIALVKSRFTGEPYEGDNAKLDLP